ncbi:hypothetical protein GWG65_36105 [Bradyrhizobium sp. CSA207]|uniref:hypothetical protein n=1 Tax=Bradyrhizobium sp. CSA207 TaxID=2698826 RepID=UPI0023AF03EB|nr:hypothetical protein [Bradyrhizobium sp. CSA207]MDE5446690.1 hypothetical protein [Bradyrhizobium sp. CSA207]
MADGQVNLSGIPAYETFVRLVTQNIGVMPEIKLDENGTAHRIQIFDGPDAIPRVLFSKRALARYKCCKDVLGYVLGKKSPESLCNMACLLLGKDLLLNNRFAGAALIAHAFTKLRSKYTCDSEVFDYMLAGVREDNQAATINFFHPLAHEIGHLERAQALAPAPIHSDKFLDTYRINYDAIWPIVGDLDYQACQKDEQSPLYLPLLREEVISDWFAVNAVMYLVCHRTRDRKFEMTEAFASLVMFPLIAAFEETCLKEWRSTRFTQQVLLATQCRFSILIDSMRATGKKLFPNHHADVDESMRDMNTLYDEALRIIWQGAVQFMSLSGDLMKLTDFEVAEYIRKETHKEQWFDLHSYLAAILDDSKGYPIFESNRAALRKAFDTMITFEALVIMDNGVVIIPKKGGS